VLRPYKLMTDSRRIKIIEASFECPDEKCDLEGMACVECLNSLLIRSGSLNSDSIRRGEARSFGVPNYPEATAEVFVKRHSEVLADAADYIFYVWNYVQARREMAVQRVEAWKDISDEIRACSARIQQYIESLEIENKAFYKTIRGIVPRRDP